MITLDVIAQFTTVVSVIVAAAAIWAGVQMNRKQMNVQVFTSYSERYERIMSSFPKEALHSRFEMSHELPPLNEELTLCVLRYLNISSEEFYLWQAGYLDKKVWQMWEHEMKRMISSPLFRREWNELKSEFVSYPEFSRFVEASQNAPSQNREQN